MAASRSGSVDAARACLREDIADHATLTGRREEDFVDEVFARVLKEGIEGTNDVCRSGGRGSGGVGYGDEAFEGVAEVADAFKVMAEGVCLWAGADDENVTIADAAIESAVNEKAINEPAEAEGYCNECNGDDNDGAGDVRSADQVESGGEEKGGGEASLEAELLLVKDAADADRSVELEAAADEYQR